MTKVRDWTINMVLLRPCVFHRAGACSACDGAGTCEYEVQVSGRYWPGSNWPSGYWSKEVGGWLPGDAPEWEIESITIGKSGTPFPWELTDNETDECLYLADIEAWD